MSVLAKVIKDQCFEIESRSGCVGGLALFLLAMMASEAVQGRMQSLVRALAVCIFLRAVIALEGLLLLSEATYDKHPDDFALPLVA